MLGHRPLTPNDYLAILKRRAWLIAIPAILLPILAVVATHFIAKQYVSQTLVLIEEQKVPDDYVKPVVTSDLDARLASMREQILSRSRLEPIIEKFNLYAGRSMDDRLDLARKAISIKPIHSEIEHSGLPGFFISFTASDPHTAQNACAEITNLFVAENSRAREQTAQGTTSFLQGQLAEAKASLDAQEAKLALFQRGNMGRLPDEEASNLNVLASLNTQLEATTQQLQRMEQDRSYQASLLNQQVHEAETQATIKPLVLDDREVQLQALQAQEADLTAHYTPDYPDVVAVHRKIADLKAQIARSPRAREGVAAKAPESASTQQLRAQLQSADQGIAAKKGEQASLQSQIHNYQDRVQSSPLVDEQYKQLTRDHETAQKSYDDLLSNVHQSQMATDLEHRQQGEQFRMVDSPNLPDAPLFPKVSLFFFGGLFLGLALGLMVAAFLEYRDTALRSESDILAFTHLPTLAVIAFSAPGSNPSPNPVKRGTGPTAALAAYQSSKVTHV